MPRGSTHCCTARKSSATCTRRRTAMTTAAEAGIHGWLIIDKPTGITSRRVEIDELRLVAMPDPDHADFEAVVGEGTYIRSLARDLAAALGTLGHIVELRRAAVGRFSEERAISLDSAVALGHKLAASANL